MSSIKRTLFIPMLITCGAMSVPVTNAQSNGDGLSYSEEVITTTQRREALFDVVGNVSQLDKEELEHINATHIQDTLLRVPGVNLQQGNGQEYLPSIRSAVLTGAGACGAFLMAQDNIPLRAAGFCNVNELFDANTESAEKIEVIRGPSNALYGSNAMHGVVNVLLPGVPGEYESSLGIEAGPNDFRRTKISYGDSFGDQGIIFNLNTTHDGGFRDDAYLDQQKMHVRHEYNGDGMRVTTAFAGTNLNQETAGYIVGADVYKDDAIIESNPNPEAYRDTQSFRLYSRVDMALNQAQQLSVTPYWRKTEMNFLQHFLPGTPLEENGQDSIGTRVAWYNDADSAVSWIVGLDVELTQSYLKQTQDQPTQGSPFLQATVPVGKHYDYEVDAVQFAPYVHLDWELNDAWELNAGLRYEAMRYDYDNLMLTGRTRDDGTTCGFGGCRYSRPADSKDDYSNFSPKLGVLYKFSSSHRAFFNIANAYRAPQATELYRLQRAQQIADLDSEEISSVELGLRGRGDRYGYEVSVYQMDKENVIIRESTNFFNVSDGETEHFGIELDFNYHFTDSLDAALTANYADHQYANDLPLASIVKGSQEDTAPKHFGSARLGWEPLDQTRFELEWVHMGSYYTDPENLHDYEGHDLFNVRASWEVNNHWHMALRVLNLTDENYAERADFTGFTGDRYFPGEPRSIYFQVTFKQ